VGVKASQALKIPHFKGKIASSLVLLIFLSSLSANESLRIPTFEEPAAIASAAASSRAVPALADLDGDRDLDLILGDADGTLQFYENTGDILSASLSAAASASVDAIDVGDRAAPALADLDHDGDMDLIVGGADGGVNYFRNDGNAFSPNFVALTGGDNPFDGLGVASNAVPTIGDIDYDNLLDVLVGAADGAVKYLSNTGTVVAPAFIVLTGADSFLDGVDFGDDAAPSLGDFDGDTDVDLVVGNAEGMTSYLNGRRGYQGDSLTAVELPDVPATGRYETGVVLVDTGWSLVDASVDPFGGLDLGDSVTCAFADLDADADADLILGDSTGAIQLMSSNKIKKMVGIRGTHGVDGNPYTDDVGPYSGLGYDPRVSEEPVLDPNASTRTVTDELIRGSLGSIEELFEINWAPPGDTGNYRTFWYTRAAGDLDGDGLLDMVTLESSVKENTTWKTSISWKSADQWNLWGLANTSATEWIEDYNDSIPEFLHGNVDLANLDKDGDLDLIVAGNACNGINNLGYYENTGDATSPNFVRRFGDSNLVQDITFDAARNSIAPKFADLDGDGDLDCAVGIDFGLIDYWENTTTGGVVSFTRKGVLASGDLHYYTQPTFGDFDRDGDLDMVVLEMSRSHKVETADSTNFNHDFWEERNYPSRYRFLKNTGSAVNPVFTERSYSDWDEQKQAGNPLFRIYLRSRNTWPSGWEGAQSDSLGRAFRRTDGLDRILIGDFNYDGYPDIHYMRQEVDGIGSAYVWNYFYRTTEDTIAPTATMRALGATPFYSSESFQVRVSFDESVDRLDLGDFSLTVGGSSIDLSTAILTGSGGSRTLDLTPLGLDGGDYTLTLHAAGSSIHDAFGIEMVEDSSLDFTLVEILEDVGIGGVAGPATAQHDEALTFTVTAVNEASVDSIGNTVAMEFSKWLGNLQLIEITTTGGAASSLATGSVASVLSDTADLPAGSSISYTFTAVADISDFIQAPREIISSVTARITPPVTFSDDYPYNEAAGCHTRFEPLSTRSGTLVDQGAVFDEAPFPISDVVELGDFNGDGLLDALIRAQHIIFNSPTGFTTNTSSVPVPVGPVLSRNSAIGDLDGDGDLDIVVPAIGLFGTRKSILFYNDGAGTFSEGPELGSSEEAILGDADHDGDLDIFFDYSIYLNDGDGTFSDSISTGGRGQLLHVVGDLDGDGDLDFISTSGVHLQDSRGSFALSATRLFGSSLASALGDLDGDGDLDLVHLPRSIQSSVEIYLNDGSGGFSESPNQIATTELEDFALGDLNNDGFLDLVATVRGTYFSEHIIGGDEGYVGTNFIYFNDGSGGFGSAMELLGDRAVWVALGDVTGDGGLDVVTSGSGYDTHNFRVWKMDTAPTITLVGDNPMMIEEGVAYSDPGATANDLEDDDLTASIIVDVSAVDTSACGIYEVVYSVTDSAGNNSEAIRVVEVLDRTPPVITLLGDNPQVIGYGNIYSELGATAVDSCDDSLGDVVIDASAVNTSVLGSYAVTYNITDASGNAAVTQTRTVNVADLTPPVITLFGDNPQVIEFGDEYEELWGSVSDNYDADLWQLQVDTSGLDLSVVGTHAVTYDISDSSGNAAATVTRLVNVVDTTRPDLVLNGDKAIGLNVGDPYTELGATATDLADGNVVVIIGGDTVNGNVEGVYVVTYTATDSFGNTATATRRIQVGGVVARLFVNETASAGGDGTTWATAFQSLGDALDRTFAGFEQEVWVAAGTYTTDEGEFRTEDDREATFHLHNGLKLYGGFGGTEASIDERDLENQTTVLTGDLQGDDRNDDGNTIAETYEDIVGDNAYTVVTVIEGSQNVILDGVTITGGNADQTVGDFGSIPDNATGKGGGLYGKRVEVALQDCTLIGNEAGNGGGFHFTSSSLTIADSTIKGNHASTGGGGGLVDSDVSMTDGRVIDNTAQSVGGMSAFGDSSGTFLNTAFSGNYGFVLGGAFFTNADVFRFTNCLFTGNRSGRSAIMHIGNNAPSIYFTNCTFAYNLGATMIGSYDGAAAVTAFDLTDCILWTNSGSIHHVDPSKVTVTGTNLNGNDDPQFVEGLTLSTSALPDSGGDFRLQESSPMIDSGVSNSNLSDNDLDGRPRVMSGVIDLGAFESGSNYDVWSANRYGREISQSVIGFESDPFETGVSNALAFLHGVAPGAEGSAISSETILNREDVETRFRSSSNLDGHHTSLEYSLDLVTWFPVTDQTPGMILINEEGGYGVDLDGFAVDRIRVMVDGQIYSERCFFRQGISSE